MRSCRRLLLLVTTAAGLFLLHACNTAYRAPDLAGLYNRAAQDHSPDRNPIIVIPGLTGSSLVDSSSGRIVWGAFSGDYARPGRPEDARLVALPMREGAALSELRDEVEPNGVLDRVKVRFLGIPISVKAYVEILAALGAGGYRDESLGLAEVVDYGDEHYTCFQFDYDWRRDNVENARRLHEFIVEKRAYVREQTRLRFGVDREDIRFDLVAHSMGGMLVRYFLRYGAADLPEDGSLPPVTWAGARDVDRVVLIGPPNAGSVGALLQLVNGRKIGFTLPTYPAAILGTYPSAYQLLQRSRHGTVLEGGDPERPVDLFSPEEWERFGWGLASPTQEKVLATLLPDVASSAERRRVALDHQRKALRRAKAFTAALDQPATPPPGFELSLVAGDSVRTPRAVAVDPSTGKLTVVAWGPGDGRVLRTSALLDERHGEDWSSTLDSPIVWDHVMFLFAGHLGITKEPAFTDNVLYWLLEAPR